MRNRRVRGSLNRPNPELKRRIVATILYGAGTCILLLLYARFDARQAAGPFVFQYALVFLFAASAGVQGFSFKEALWFYAAYVLVGVVVVAGLLALAFLQGTVGLRFGT
jgi:hypothetical protein